jgi:hypothetical protein
MLDSAARTTERIQVAENGATQVWQARIGRDLAAELLADAEVLGLNGRTEIVKAGLALLHRRAAEERLARGIKEFYGDAEPPLPIGVLDEEPAPAATTRKRSVGGA